MTDELDLAPIKARLMAATEGPWEYDYTTGFIWQFSGDGSTRIDAIADVAYADGNHHRNGEFITDAHNTDEPALIVEVERLRALLEKREGEPYEAMRVRLAQALKENAELRVSGDQRRIANE